MFTWEAGNWAFTLLLSQSLVKCHWGVGAGVRRSMSTSGASVSLQVRVQWKSLKKSNRYDLLAAKTHGGQGERYTNEDTQMKGFW